MLNVGWFSSFCDREAVDLFEAAMKETRSGRIKVHIPWVYCNELPPETRERVTGIVGADSTPLLCIKSKNFQAALRENPATRDEWRELYDKAILDFLQHSQKPDVIIFAGYMLIVTAVLYEYFDILNLHPALPWGPPGTWQQVTRQIVGQEKKETGSSMLWVTKDLDAGPAASFSRVNVEDCDLEEVREKQFAQEIPLVLATLDGIAKGTIGTETKPVDLTSVMGNL